MQQREALIISFSFWESETCLGSLHSVVAVFSGGVTFVLNFVNLQFL